jgi:hypothetical protein
MRAIARAYGDEPLDRIVTGASGRVVYLINPSSVGATKPEPLSGVGFPRWAVFEYDSQLLESLIAAWDAGNNETLQKLWSEARAYDMPLS